MRVVVAGGAGFIGSHLCESLLGRGDEVVCVDDLSTGNRSNVSHLDVREGFTFCLQDVARSLVVDGKVDAVVNLASPASPKDYLMRPLQTLDVGSNGTRRALELAERNSAVFLLTSTSEVYGDPELHPQPETYWGRVNPVGPRSVYDEAKRFAEALSSAYQRERGVDVRIARIFNTYGPRLRPSDGRVVSNFLWQALNGLPLTVYGDGSQTRSLCYVDDQVAGLVRLLDTPCLGPVNIGNPAEISVRDLATKVVELTASASAIVFEPLPVDDPMRRRPDIGRAREILGWQPTVDLADGLARTAAWMSGLLT